MVHGRMTGRACRDGRDAGMSMVVTVLSMMATAVLVALLLGTMLDSSSGSSSKQGIDNAPGVAMATGEQAQQSLQTGLSTAASAAGAAGGLGSVDAAQLSAANPSITFVNGPSTDATTVSVAVAPGPGGEAGSITLAARASDGTCWLVWSSAGSATWFGAQTGLSSCTAPQLATAPTPGPVSSTAIGWNSGSFPQP
ncbi:MAG: hypothetical protein ACLQPH_12655 [Acidimicrobiales bacterium]